LYPYEFRLSQPGKIGELLLCDLSYVHAFRDQGQGKEDLVRSTMTIRCMLAQLVMRNVTVQREACIGRVARQKTTNCTFGLGFGNGATELGHFMGLHWGCWFLSYNL
jgi:hypothetical protein